MKNGPIDKILRIQLGLYIRKPGEKNLAHEKLILMRGIAVENLKTPIMGSKIKVVVNFIYGYQNLSGEKYKTNEKRISSIGHTSYEKNPKNHPKTLFFRKVTFWVVFWMTPRRAEPPKVRFCLNKTKAV